MNSGIEYATTFSNKANSFKSSLGFFVTSKTYVGRNGLSLKVQGLEKGYNDLLQKDILYYMDLIISHLSI